jgi:hypothetical protein
LAGKQRLIFNGRIFRNSDNFPPFMVNNDKVELVVQDAALSKAALLACLAGSRLAQPSLAGKGD